MNPEPNNLNELFTTRVYPIYTANNRGIRICEILLNEDAVTQSDDESSDDTDNGDEMETSNIQDSHKEMYDNIREDIRKIITGLSENANNPAEIKIDNMKTECLCSVQEGKTLTQEVESLTLEMTDDASTEDNESCTSTEERKMNKATEDDQKTNEDTNAQQGPTTSQENAHCQLHCKCHGVGNNRTPKISIEAKINTLLEKLNASDSEGAVFNLFDMYKVSRKQRVILKPIIDEVVKVFEVVNSRKNRKLNRWIRFSLITNEL